MIDNETIQDEDPSEQEIQAFLQEAEEKPEISQEDFMRELGYKVINPSFKLKLHKRMLVQFRQAQLCKRRGERTI